VIIGGYAAAARMPRRQAATIRLIVILNDVSFRNLIPGELAKRFRFSAGKGQTAFSPGRGHRPDELGRRMGWSAKLAGGAAFVRRRQAFGRPESGIDMTFEFPTLIAHAAKTRPLLNGVIVGSGPSRTAMRTAVPASRSARRRGLLLHRGNPLGRNDPPMARPKRRS
jgi:fumarylacetoacetate (FAA) hydrolase